MHDSWFMMGVSSGFGQALAEAVLANGNKVVGTLRNEAAQTEFAQRVPGCSFGILLDVTDEASVRRGVEEAERRTGGIDSLIASVRDGLE